MKTLLSALFGTLIVFSFGCRDPYTEEKAAQQKPEPTATGIFGQKTDEIGEFDPDANEKISDGKVKEWSPLNPIGSVRVYGSAAQNISKMHITQAVNLFYAEKGYYPRDYDEFMEEIIKKNQIELPVLPGQRKYQYDVKNHELVVVEPTKESPPK